MNQEFVCCQTQNHIHYPKNCTCDLITDYWQFWGQFHRTVATGLSFISIFAILSMILIPIIDSIKYNSNVDSRLNITKLKKDLLKELLNYRSTTYKQLNEDEINHLYNKLTNKLSVINTF